MVNCQLGSFSFLFIGPWFSGTILIFSSSGFRGHETFNSESFSPRCIIFARGVGGSGCAPVSRPELIVSVVYIWQQNDRYFYRQWQMINNVRIFFSNDAIFNTATLDYQRHLSNKFSRIDQENSLHIYAGGEETWCICAQRSTELCISSDREKFSRGRATENIQRLHIINIDITWYICIQRLALASHATLSYR